MLRLHRPVQVDQMHGTWDGSVHIFGFGMAGEEAHLANFEQRNNSKEMRLHVELMCERDLKGRKILITYPVATSRLRRRSEYLASVIGEGLSHINAERPVRAVRNVQVPQIPIPVLPFQRAIIDENDNGVAGIEERSQKPAGSFPRTCLAEACASDILARSSIEYTESDIWSAFMLAGDLNGRRG
jgi:hypothetical protein